MASVFDVASYILQECGGMTTWKLQKLVYYCQAWSLVWDDEPIFPEKIEAWANGPVVRELYSAHRKRYSINSISRGNPEQLTEDQVITINIVLEHYGVKSSQYLSDLTHMEEPWKRARTGLPDNVRGNQEISLESMAEYYESILPEEGMPI